MLRSDVIVTAPMISAPTNANAMYDSRPVRSTIAEAKPMSRPHANTAVTTCTADEHRHRLAEDAVPDEHPIEAVAVLDGEWPAGQRKPGEPGERGGDAAELGQAGRRRDGTLAEVAEAHRDAATPSG